MITDKLEQALLIIEGYKNREKTLKKEVKEWKARYFREYKLGESADDLIQGYEEKFGQLE